MRKILKNDNYCIKIPRGCLNFIKAILNPEADSILIHSFASWFIGGYLNSSPSAFCSVRILKEFNLNNRGC